MPSPTRVQGQGRVPLAEGETWHGKSLLPTQACEEAADRGFAW